MKVRYITQLCLSLALCGYSMVFAEQMMHGQMAGGQTFSAENAKWKDEEIAHAQQLFAQAVIDLDFNKVREFLNLKRTTSIRKKIVPVVDLTKKFDKDITIQANEDNIHIFQQPYQLLVYLLLNHNFFSSIIFRTQLNSNDINTSEMRTKVSELRTLVSEQRREAEKVYDMVVLLLNCNAQDKEVRPGDTNFISLKNINLLETFEYRTQKDLIDQYVYDYAKIVSGHIEQEIEREEKPGYVNPKIISDFDLVYQMYLALDNATYRDNK